MGHLMLVETWLTEVGFITTDKNGEVWSFSYEPSLDRSTGTWGGYGAGRIDKVGKFEGKLNFPYTKSLRKISTLEMREINGEPT